MVQLAIKLRRQILLSCLVAAIAGAMATQPLVAQSGMRLVSSGFSQPLAPPNQGMHAEPSKWMQIADNATIALPVFTAECWAKFLNGGLVVTRDHPTGSPSDWQLWYEHARKRLAFISAAGAGDTYYYTADNTITPGQWHHIALTVDGPGGWAKLYVDGVLLISPTFTARQFNSSTGLAWGGYYNNASGAYLRGYFDECRYWSVTRSQGEILATKDRTLSLGERSNLHGYWMFCGNYADSSGYHNDGQPMGLGAVVDIPDLPIGIGCEGLPPPAQIPRISARGLSFVSRCPKDVPKDSIIWVHDTGGTTLTLRSATLSGVGKGAFEIIEPRALPPSVDVRAGDSLRMVIRFNPPGTGLYSAILELRSNAVPDSVLLLPLSGSKDSIGLAGTAVDFGTCTGGMFPRDTTVDVVNHGSVPLALVGAGVSSSSFSILTSFPVTLFPGDTLKLRIRFFKPMNELDVRERISIDYVPRCDSVILPLSGRLKESGSVVGPDSLFIRVLRCGVDSADFVTGFTNRSTKTVTVSSFTMLPAGLFELRSPSTFPVLLPPGAALNVRVRVRPATFGRFTGTLTLVTDAPENPVIVLVMVYEIAPIQIAATGANFGTVLPGSFPVVRQVLIRNSSQDTVIVTGVRLLRSSPFRILTSMPIRIPPGGISAVMVQFDDPGPNGTYSDSLSLSYLPPCDSIVAIVTGRKEEPPVVRFPADLTMLLAPCDFGPADTVLTLENPGPSALIITGAQFAANVGFRFSPDPVLPLVVPPGGKAEFRIRFHPWTMGIVNTELLLTTNVPGHLTVRIPVHGSSGGSRLELSALGFGSVGVGQFPVIRTMLLKNTGNLPVQIDSLFFPLNKPFTVLTRTPQTLAPGASLSISVRFDEPPSDGLWLDSLVVLYTPPCALVRAVVSGRRTHGPAIAATEMDFAGLPCEESHADSAIVVHNTGGQTLTLSAGRIEGDSAFHLRSSFPRSIPAGGSDTLTVRFGPSPSGTHSGMLVLTSDAENAPELRIPLSGRIDVARATATSLDFGRLLAKDFPGQRTMRIDNTGTVSITVTGLRGRGGTPFHVSGGIPVTIAPGGFAEIIVEFSDPLIDGIQADTVELIIDPSCEPTLALLRGERISRSSVTFASALGFAALRCPPVYRDTLVTLRNTGDRAIVIDSAMLLGDPCFSLRPPFGLPYPLSVGDSLRIGIRFAPIAAGTWSAQLRLHVAAPADTVLTMECRGTMDSLLLTAMPLNFGTQVPDPLPLVQVVTLKNSGTVSLTATGYRWTSGAVFSLSSAVPLTLAPGASAPLAISFNRSHPAGTYADTLVLLYAPSCDVLRVPVHGTLGRGAEPRSAALSVSSSCLKSMDSVVFVHNDGGTELRLLSASVTGDAAFALASPFLPRSVLPGDSTGIVIRYSPSSAANAAAELLLACNSVPDTHRVLLTGRSELPAISSVNLDFGAVRHGDFPVTRMCVLHNSGTTVMRIDSASSSMDGAFEIVGGLPAQLATGDSCTLVVRFDEPVSDALLSDTLTFHTFPAPCGGTALVVHGSRLRPSIVIEAGTGRAAPGDVVEIPLHVRGMDPSTLARVTHVRTQLRYRKTLLAPLFAHSGSIEGDDRVLPLVLPMLLKNGDELTVLSFRAMLGDDTSTVLTLEHSEFVDGRVDVTELPGRFTLTNLCRDGGTRLFYDGGPLTLAQNRPNPFNPATVIEFRTIETAHTMLLVYDATGREVGRLVDGVVEPGSHRARFDATALPSGMYRYVLVTPGSMLQRTMLHVK